MTLPGSSLPLAILAGRADDMRAEITVRVGVGEVNGDGSRLHLAGTLVGPRRGRDMTLPTTVKLVDVTGDHAAANSTGHALGRAVFTEPAYWTPELPNLYRLHAEIQRGDQTVAVVDRMVGLRRLGVRGRSLWLESRRWVPRGVTIPPTGFDPTALRSLSAAAVVNDPTAAICAAADQAGVAIIARLEGADGVPLDTAGARTASLHGRCIRRSCWRWCRGWSPPTGPGRSSLSCGRSKARCSWAWKWMARSLPMRCRQRSLAASIASSLIFPATECPTTAGV